MPHPEMPLATRERALRLGAALIEADLAQMRHLAVERDRQSTEHGQVYPVTHCLEHDLMKAAEWASAAATLRAMEVTD